MKTPEKKKLLSELFDEPDDVAHRRQSHAAFLREARRRKTVRFTRSALALAASVLLLGALLLKLQTSIPPSERIAHVAPPSPLPYEVVHSSSDAVEYVTSPATEIAVVRTSGTVETIDDVELLGLFKGRSMALVTLQSGQKTLHFFE